MSLRRYLIFFLSAAVVSSAAWPVSVAAQSYKDLPKSEKRRLAGLIEEGLAAYDRGEFERALQHFRDAYDIYAHPDLLYRLGLAYEKLDEVEEAIRHYRMFLEEVPDAKERGRIEATVRRLEKRLASEASQVRIKTNPAGATVFINDEINGPAGTTPIELPVSSGNYKIILKKEGHQTIEDVVDVPKGQTLVLNYALTSTAPTPSDGDDGIDVPVGPVVVAGVGLISLGSSLYFYGKYTEKRDQFEEYEALKGTGQDRPDDYDEVLDDRNFYQGATWVSAGVGLGALTAATVWWLAGSGQSEADAPRADSSYRLTPRVAPTGATLQFELDY